jgi:GNAT superfamily N-acetyltransferase
MNVRRFKDMKDAERMIALGAQMHAESVFASEPYLSDKLMAYCRFWLTDPTSGMAFLAEDNEEVVGMMAGWCLEAFFNHERTARDMILYVRPDKRGGMTAIRLVKAFEDWAKEAGAHHINIGVSAGIDNQRAAKFYQSLGYAPRGVTLSKEVCHHG